MKSYVIEWIDLFGRVRIKQYAYRKCAERFALSLALSGEFEDTVIYDTYEHGCRIRHQTFKGVRV